MLKAYKYRLYPNKEQQEYFAKCFGCVRFIYNRMLSDKIEYYKETKQKLNNTPAQYKKEFPWLKEVDSLALANAQMNLQSAYNNFFKRPEVGFPKFKSKKNHYYSYTTNNQGGNIYVSDKYIKLPKIGLVKVKKHRDFEGIIKSVAVSKKPSGKYYVSVLYEMSESIKEVTPTSIIGIDLGVKKLLTLSDGNSYENNKYIEKYEKRIKRMQRELSRKVKGSNNYYKCKKKLAVLHSKLANSRKYYIHKITKNITDEYDIVTCEKLHTKEMIISGKKNTLSKNINDACFNEILKQLEYKSKFKGKKFYQIYEYYPSSQTCSGCDNQDKKYKNLNERNYECTKCHLELDRDLNASINIMFEGLKMYIEKLNKIIKNN